jgi:sigma-B regulation protein RsbU (phosphoserine phosphatase)
MVGRTMDLADAEQLAEFRFPARAEELQHLRSVVRSALDSLGCSAEFVHGTVLALDEAATNVIRHGYGDSSGGEAVLQIFKTGNVLVFRLVDFAPTVDCEAIRPRELDDLRPGGLGVHIMRQVMDTVEFQKPAAGAGNVLVMTRKLERPLR